MKNEECRKMTKQVNTRQELCSQLSTLQTLPHSKFYFQLTEIDSSFPSPIVEWDSSSSRYLITLKCPHYSSDGTEGSFPYPILAKDSKGRFYVAFSDFKGKYKQNIALTEDEAVVKLLGLLGTYDVIAVTCSKEQPQCHAANAGFWFRVVDIKLS